MSVIFQKICLIGDFSVGKTSLIRRFVEDKFSDNYLTTVGVKVSRKSIKVNASLPQVNLLIWDIEGYTKQKSITSNYLKGAHGAIIVGDLTRNNTLEHLKNHLELFLQINPQGKMVIALNKYDLISQEKVERLAELHNLENCEGVLNTYITSAKTGDRVELMFEELTTQLVKLV